MDLRHTIVKMTQALKGELPDQNEADYIREFLASKGSHDPWQLSINDVVECFATLEAMKIVRQQKAASVAIHQTIFSRLTKPVPLPQP